MFSVLAVYLILGHHPRAHITAEVLQQKIEQTRIHQLYPSLFITRALHTGLLHITRNPSFRHTVPFVQFLWKARESFVHAVDHVNVARILHNLNSTWYTLFRSSVFFKTFVDSTTNPLFSNKICTFGRDTVYGKIYADLVKENEDMRM
ncbi:hypothetical protein BCR33DRAFT_716174 [Rhizoclosmatium globosum]|uniref:Uncharacterized protein n=1 Tax=Rhizoclosmatium globosum TaxID=329046 RepID=A0A1Y2CEL8_9FUNG|nr:hypothetical protein BCR33DRAFT_716174 [Rhizoclosmatium globosum]|eukprot:ORY45489.1 hypothetical protein BCR33DRAFT_716174 [Rhizoclosmatium globosum]